MKTHRALGEPVPGQYVHIKKRRITEWPVTFSLVLAARRILSSISSRCLPTNRRIMVEGLRLLPHLVKPLLSALDLAVWLLPTSEFRQAAIERRGGWASGFLAKTSNPERPLQNLLERGRMFTDRLRAEVEGFELRAIEVDTTND